jgi:hypothetical protein
MTETNPEAGPSNGSDPLPGEAGQSIVEALLWISLIVLIACGVASGFSSERARYRASLKSGLPSVKGLAGG